MTPRAPGPYPADLEGEQYERADVRDDEQALRISVPRFALALALVVTLFGASGFAVHRALATSVKVPATPTANTWFAPYVDTTLPPFYQFQDPSQNPSGRVVLGFVVSEPKAACTPSWGGFYTLGQAAGALSLDRRVAQLRLEGGSPVISFGGQAGPEMALGCKSVTRLKDAYRTVVQRYGTTTIDFDLEGPALTDQAAARRRAEAVAALQSSQLAAGHPLAVWLTVPVASGGFLPDALRIVHSTLAAGVKVSGVNIMAMNYGRPEPDMLETVEGSMVAAEAQLARLFRSPHEAPVNAWDKLGVTVMVGQNTSPGEAFTVNDARAIVAYARAKDVGRVSMWSLNRDYQCGAPAFAETDVLSDSCSGVIEGDLEFARTFAALQSGSANGGARVVIGPSTAPNNPANSPYPVWEPWPTYVQGYRVERDGDIYQAKWDNQGVDPTTVMASTFVNPWQLLGPVLPTDKAPVVRLLTSKKYPQWSAAALYPAGARVMFDGEPYQARWANMSDSPAAASLDASESAWHPLFSVPGEPSAGS